jgi:hypothetical protein
MVALLVTVGRCPGAVKSALMVSRARHALAARVDRRSRYIIDLLVMIEKFLR